MSGLDRLFVRESGCDWGAGGLQESGHATQPPSCKRASSGSAVLLCIVLLCCSCVFSCFLSCCVPVGGARSVARVSRRRAPRRPALRARAAPAPPRERRARSRAARPRAPLRRSRLGPRCVVKRYRSTSRATSTRRTTHPPVRSRDETTTLLPEQRVARGELRRAPPAPPCTPHATLSTKTSNTRHATRGAVSPREP